MSIPYTFRNPKSSINSQTHCPKNNWLNYNTIAMVDEDWEEEDMKEFTRSVEKSKKTC
jgi:hypothetical protein